MPTQRRIQRDYACSPGDLVALFRDPEFLRARCHAAGDQDVTVTVEQQTSGFRLLIVRERDVSLPSFARRLFKPRTRISDQSQWRRDAYGWTADYAIQIHGLSGETRGRTTVTPRPFGCRYESYFEVTSTVALLGSKIEGFIADRIEEGLSLGAERNAAFLASRSPAAAPLVPLVPSAE